MHRSSGWLLVILLLCATALPAQDATDARPRRHSLGSSGFILANAVLSDAPDFYQLNYGYWRSPRDFFSIEALTWKYDAPLGIPYGPSFDAPEEKYPGYVRAYGAGGAYQRRVWRGSFLGVHATFLRQQYVDDQGARIASGFQLFLAGRVGYHVSLLRDRFFLEPSVAATHWPINSNVPAAFAEKNRKWPNYFLFEPGLHFGVKF